MAILAEVKLSMIKTTMIGDGKGRGKSIVAFAAHEAYLLFGAILVNVLTLLQGLIRHPILHLFAIAFVHVQSTKLFEHSPYQGHGIPVLVIYLTFKQFCRLIKCQNAIAKRVITLDLTLKVKTQAKGHVCVRCQEILAAFCVHFGSRADMISGTIRYPIL